jgi:hypothetical protein
VDVIDDNLSLGKSEPKAIPSAAYNSQSGALQQQADLPEGITEALADMVPLISATNAVTAHIRLAGKELPMKNVGIRASAKLFNISPEQLRSFLQYVAAYTAGANLPLRRSGELGRWTAPAGRRPKRRRADRAAKIEAIKNELVAHIRAARDHAFTFMQSNREPRLLERPNKSELARRAGIKRYDLTRCFDDDPQLKQLWHIAGDLELVMKYGR